MNIHGLVNSVLVRLAHCVSRITALESNNWSSLSKTECYVN